MINAKVIVRQPTTVITSIGLPGMQGQQGESGGTIQLIAGINLGGNRVVTGNSTYADNTELSTIGRAIGVTQGAAVAGDPVGVVLLGELDGFFGLTVNEPVYLSVSGTTTQTLPTSGYIQRIGVAISTTKILLNLSDPIGQL